MTPDLLGFLCIGLPAMILLYFLPDLRSAASRANKRRRERDRKDR